MVIPHAYQNKDLFLDLERFLDPARFLRFLVPFLGLFFFEARLRLTLTSYLDVLTVTPEPELPDPVLPEEPFL
jgi:hypothetical protein